MSGRVAIVRGGGSSIGRPIAMKLAGAGAGAGAGAVVAIADIVESNAAAVVAIRAESRTMSTEQQRAAFYKDRNDIIPSALVYLDKKPLNGFDEI